MSRAHNQDRHWLKRLQLIDRSELELMHRFELEHWRQVAIRRELDRRDTMARCLLKG